MNEEKKRRNNKHFVPRSNPSAFRETSRTKFREQAYHSRHANAADPAEFLSCFTFTNRRQRLTLGAQHTLAKYESKRAIRKCVAQSRKALIDSTFAPSFISSFPTIYCFILKMVFLAFVRYFHCCIYLFFLQTRNVAVAFRAGVFCWSHNL